MSGYFPILIMMAIASVIAGAMVFGSFFLGPKKPGKIKETPYECGMKPVGNARERFPVKFFLIAMLFIVFDIETIFLYPWAVAYHSMSFTMKLFNYFEMGIFVAILFVGYFYLIGKGALDWEESELAKKHLDPSFETLAPRPAIRFGNEASGKTDLSQLKPGPRIPSYGASAQEEYQELPQQNPDYTQYTDPKINPKEQIAS